MVGSSAVAIALGGSDDGSDELDTDDRRRTDEFVCPFRRRLEKGFLPLRTYMYLGSLRSPHVSPSLASSRSRDLVYIYMFILLNEEKLPVPVDHMCTSERRAILAMQPSLVVVSLHRSNTISTSPPFFSPPPRLIPASTMYWPRFC